MMPKDFQVVLHGWERIAKKRKENAEKKIQGQIHTFSIIHHLEQETRFFAGIYCSITV